MKFRLRHPDDPNGFATYGYDGPSGLGFFVHAITSTGEWTYDATSPNYNAARPLDGALRFLAARGFCTEENLEEALERLVEQLPEEMPRRCGRIARAVLNFKRAAD